MEGWRRGGGRGWSSTGWNGGLQTGSRAKNQQQVDLAARPRTDLHFTVAATLLLRARALTDYECDMTDVWSREIILGNGQCGLSRIRQHNLLSTSSSSAFASTTFARCYWALAMHAIFRPRHFSSFWDFSCSGRADATTCDPSSRSLYAAFIHHLSINLLHFLPLSLPTFQSESRDHRSICP